MEEKQKYTRKLLKKKNGSTIMAIPKPILEALEVKGGNYMEIELHGEEIIIKPKDEEGGINE